MNRNESNIWPKQITVDKRIVKILSESTYENFPNALKEIIINSYDAKSTLVNISVDIESEQIIIFDNGNGMSESDFDFFIRIAGKTRQKEELSSSKRRIVGQFGVGFLSIFPFFENYDIETKKAGNSEILKANIPCFKYFDDYKKDSKILDVSAINISGRITVSQSPLESHYTKTILTGFTRLTKNFFNPSLDQTPRKNSIHNFNGLKKLVWKLEEDLPIKYEEENYNLLFKESYTGPGFEVYVNKNLLLRRVWGKQLLETHQGNYKQFGRIKVKYFINTSGSVIKPNEAKHIKIRNLNVGVGERTAFGLGEEVGGFRSKINWLTGEVHILDGMNDLVKVSRDGFNFSSDYERLKDYFISRLSFHSTRLEKGGELNNFLNTNKDATKVKNIKLLEPNVLKNKILEFKESLSGPVDTNVFNYELEDQLRHLNIENFRKIILINNKKYILKSEKWDYRTDFFPACKIENKTIILNKSYPLFNKKSHTDFFVKLHFLLLVNFQERVIDESTYKKLTRDIIRFFNDYL